MQKKLLLFGGTGFVGSRIAQKALSRGYKVVIATRGGVPALGTPMDALARRVRTIGGPAAAREVLYGSADLSSPGKGADHSNQQDVSASTGTRNGGAAASSRPSADELAAMVHSVDESTALAFISIDASSREQVFHFLHDHPDATAIINSVGLLTRDYDEAREVNGDVMNNVAAGVYHPKLVPQVTKVVYVSAEPYNLYSPRVIGSKRLLKGYFHGKQIGERAVLRNLGERGVVLRPGFIYGARPIYMTSATNPEALTTITLPLSWVGYPVDKLLSAVGGKKLLIPPVDVDVVAETAVRACAFAGLPTFDVHGICDVYKMHEVCDGVDPTLCIGRAAAESPVSVKEKEK